MMRYVSRALRGAALIALVVPVGCGGGGDSPADGGAPRDGGYPRYAVAADAVVDDPGAMDAGAPDAGTPDAGTSGAGETREGGAALAPRPTGSLH